MPPPRPQRQPKACKVIPQMFFCLLSWCLPLWFPTVRGIAPLPPKATKGMQGDSSDVLLFAFLVFALWFPTVRQIAPIPPKATKGMQSDSSDVLLFTFLVRAPRVANGAGSCPPSPQRQPKACKVILQMFFCLLSWCLPSGSQRCGELPPPPQKQPKACKVSLRQMIHL